MADDNSKKPDSNDSAATLDAETLANSTAARGSVDAVSEKEVGGRTGPDPTRYGDWEKNGRCIDF